MSLPLSIGNLGASLNAGSANTGGSWGGGAGGSNATSPMNGSPQHRPNNWNSAQGATSPMPGVTPTGTPVHQMKSPMDGPSRPDYSRSHFDTAFKPNDAGNSNLPQYLLLLSIKFHSKKFFVVNFLFYKKCRKGKAWHQRFRRCVW